jgi:hypothetical protein
MKLKQIDFDHKLIGTEGIVVKYKCGDVPDFIKKYGDRIVSIDNTGDWNSHKLDGHYYDMNRKCEWDLVMYRTVKVMTVDEFKDYKWPVHSGLHADVVRLHISRREGAGTLAAAIKRGEVDISDNNG